MNWRINYGNGQVHDVASRKAALAELKAETTYRGFCRIQRRGDSPSGWVTVRLTRVEQDAL